MKVLLVHQNSDSLTKEVKKDGWSWGAFFFGPLWYWIHGMVGDGFRYLFISWVLVITIIGPMVMWFVMGKKFNQEYYQNLLERGYKESK